MELTRAGIILQINVILTTKQYKTVYIMMDNELEFNRRLKDIKET